MHMHTIAEHTMKVIARKTHVYVHGNSMMSEQKAQTGRSIPDMNRNLTSR